MSLSVLERLKMPAEELDFTFKTFYNGQLKVLNVPHALFPEGIGPDGEEEYIPGNVMYKLSRISRYMIDNDILEMDYQNFN